MLADLGNTKKKVLLLFNFHIKLPLVSTQHLILNGTKLLDELQDIK